MKKEYTGLKAERVELGTYNMVTEGSLPPGCIQIVADYVEPGDRVCQNPGSTISYKYLFDNPGFPDD